MKEHFNNTKIFNKILKTLLAILLLAVVEQVHAADAKARIVPDSILIGQPATLFVEVESNRGDVFVPLSLNDSIYNHLEIWGSKIDTASVGENRVAYNISIFFTSWQAGKYNFDPIDVIFLQNNDTLKYQTNQFSLVVLTVDIDDDATIYDIKPIKKMRASLREILTYFIPLVLLLALIGWLVYRYFFKKKKPVAVSIWEDEEIPAHIAAISSLEKLRSQKLWQMGKVKQYHSELTFIVRMFIEKRFMVPALEMTTNEIFKTLPLHLDNKPSINELKGTLEVADLVKFAKYQPLPNENEKSLEQAIEFVKANIEPDKIDEDSKKNSEKDSLEPNE